MTRFTLHNSNGETKEIGKEEEKSDHDLALEFLSNMLEYFKKESDKKIKSLAIISTYEENESEENFSLAGYNLPADDIILLLEKIKIKLLIEDTIVY